MTLSTRIPVRMLGQSGCRLEFSGATVYVDPYLSNSVQILDAPDLERQQPIPLQPEQVNDADWVLITHEHIDHCDPHTLPKLARASSQAHFIGPMPVLRKLAEWGIDEARMHLAVEGWIKLVPGLRVHAIPAAHPEIQRDGEGNLACLGFLLEYANERLYLAGDTAATQEVIDAVSVHGPVHTAFLPVNEHNFFKGRRGIIGNMSVREAFQFGSEIGARQVVAVHWDMFASNAVDPDEIRLIHQRVDPGFALLIQPTQIKLGAVQCSIVIRTLNEAHHLEALLMGIAAQQTNGLKHEILLVDSGSTDGTIEIAKRHGCRIHHIAREEFSFGRSLNIGCNAAVGDVLVIISGHCVPADVSWLESLCKPILDGVVDCTYGRQLGGPESHYSECRIFAKYFPEHSQIPQEGFFCNNANSALSRRAWETYRFDEDLTGLEDMDLAKRLVKDGGQVGYAADAPVFHYHDESWSQIRRRFEREAIALQKIMPQVHVSLVDTLRYFVSSVWKDFLSVRQEHPQRVSMANIIRYRWNQYVGSWKGNHEHRKLSHTDKEKYFFPH